MPDCWRPAGTRIDNWPGGASPDKGGCQDGCQATGEPPAQAGTFGPLPADRVGERRNSSRPEQALIGGHQRQVTKGQGAQDAAEPGERIGIEDHAPFFGEDEHFPQADRRDPELVG